MEAFGKGDSQAALELFQAALSLRPNQVRFTVTHWAVREEDAVLRATTQQRQPRFFLVSWAGITVCTACLAQLPVVAAGPLTHRRGRSSATSVASMSKQQGRCCIAGYEPCSSLQPNLASGGQPWSGLACKPRVAVQDEARAALYNGACARARLRQWQEAADDVVRAVNEFGLKFEVAAKARASLYDAPGSVQARGWCWHRAVPESAARPE